MSDPNLVRWDPTNETWKPVAAGHITTRITDPTTPNSLSQVKLKPFEPEPPQLPYLKIVHNPANKKRKHHWCWLLYTNDPRKPYQKGWSRWHWRAKEVARKAYRDWQKTQKVRPPEIIQL